MNIFCTDRDAGLSASYLDDKRVIKMVLETAQLLSSAIRSHGINEGYRISHLNHPCAKWTRASRQHFLWLVEHGKALNRTYYKAYGKTHQAVYVIDECLEYASVIPDNGWTDWPNCTDDKVSDIPITDLYRNYMNRKWNNDDFVVTWKNRPIPEWRE